MWVSEIQLTKDLISHIDVFRVGLVAAGFGLAVSILTRTTAS